jgi:hypothetical protein
MGATMDEHSRDEEQNEVKLPEERVTVEYKPQKPDGAGGLMAMPPSGCRSS